MNIIKIGKDAMKISLCNEEAEELGFSNKESEENMKASFIRLLIRTKEQLDFVVMEQKIVGEIFSGNDGGCEIFVSRVEAQDKVYKEKIPQEAIKKPRQLASVFVFDRIDNLISATKRLMEIGYNRTSSVYYDEENEKYYIILEDVSIKDIKYSFLAEYARAIKGGRNIYIKEHYKCLCKNNGVKILSGC